MFNPFRKKQPINVSYDEYVADDSNSSEEMTDDELVEYVMEEDCEEESEMNFYTLGNTLLIKEYKIVDSGSLIEGRVLASGEDSEYNSFDDEIAVFPVGKGKELETSYGKFIVINVEDVLMFIQD